MRYRGTCRGPDQNGFATEAVTKPPDPWRCCKLDQCVHCDDQGNHLGTATEPFHKERQQRNDQAKTKNVDKNNQEQCKHERIL